MKVILIVRRLIIMAEEGQLEPPTAARPYQAPPARRAKCVRGSVLYLCTLSLYCISVLYLCIRLYMFACVCVCVRMYVCVSVCLRVCVSACLRVCVSACLYVNVCIACLPGEWSGSERKGDTDGHGSDASV